MVFLCSIFLCYLVHEAKLFRFYYLLCIYLKCYNKINRLQVKVLKNEKEINRNCDKIVLNNVEVITFSVIPLY